MLTRERMERMIDAKDSGEAAKVLSECGYGELTQLTSAALEELLADARRNTFRDMADSVPDRRLVEAVSYTHLDVYKRQVPKRPGDRQSHQ